MPRRVGESSAGDAPRSPLADGQPVQRRNPERGANQQQRTSTHTRKNETRIGSGSDHTVFLNHLGRPVVGLEFTGDYGVYHSMYDDHYWMEHFGDPGFKYHTLMAQLWGVLALRLANADVLPFDFGVYAARIRGFIRDLEKANKSGGKLDLRPLQRRTVEFQDAGRALRHEIEKHLAQNRLGAKDKAALNRAAMQVERNWLHPDGIPGRPWFKHTLYAARYTYAHLELPGLTEAVEAGNWKLAREQVRILDAALEKNTKLLRAARAELERETHAVETKVK